MAKRYPEEPIEVAQFGTCLFPFEDSELLAKGDHLQAQVMPREEEGAKVSQNGKTEPGHSSDLKRIWMAFAATARVSSRYEFKF
jgi:hypothetical protein